MYTRTFGVFVGPLPLETFDSSGPMKLELPLPPYKMVSTFRTLGVTLRRPKVGKRKRPIVVWVIQFVTFVVVFGFIFSPTCPGRTRDPRPGVTKM